MPILAYQFVSILGDNCRRYRNSSTYYFRHMYNNKKHFFAVMSALFSYCFDTSKDDLRSKGLGVERKNFFLINMFWVINKHYFFSPYLTRSSSRSRPTDQPYGCLLLSIFSKCILILYSSAL